MPRIARVVAKGYPHHARPDESVRTGHTKGQYRWINYSELNGWNGKAAKDYGVWSTPRMYLLDREKRIIVKPASVDELRESIAPLKLVNTE